MADKLVLPLGISLSSDIEVRSDRATPFRARVRWVDPVITTATLRDARSWDVAGRRPLVVCILPATVAVPQFYARATDRCGIIARVLGGEVEAQRSSGWTNRSY
jgi:hypothetical protein